MPEATGDTTIHLTKEMTQQSRYPNLVFEPGTHGANVGTNSGQQQAAEQYDRYSRGDPYAHPWNNELIQRVRLIQPRIIAIDGLGFDLTNANNGNGRPIVLPASPDETWISLPTTPERINASEKSVLVVDGDTSDLGIPFDYPLLVSSRDADMQAIRQALDNKIIQDSSSMSDADITLGLGDKSSVGKAILWTAGIIDLAIGASVVRQVVKRDAKFLSRRAFLKGSAAVGVTAAAAIAAHKLGTERKVTAGNIAAEAANSITEAQKQRVLDVIDSIDPKEIKNKFEQMRTALHILKMKDAIDQLNLPQDVSSCVIMGDGHSLEAVDFLTDDKLAQAAISDYLTSISPIIDHVLHRYPQIGRETVIEKIKSFLPLTFVQQVDQPDPDSFWTPDFPNAVAKATKVITRFNSKRVAIAASFN